MDSLTLKKRTKKPVAGRMYLCFFPHGNRWEVLERCSKEWLKRTESYTQHYADGGGAVSDWYDLPTK